MVWPRPLLSSPSIFVSKGRRRQSSNLCLYRARCRRSCPYPCHKMWAMWARVQPLPQALQWPILLLFIFYIFHLWFQRVACIHIPYYCTGSRCRGECKGEGIKMHQCALFCDCVSCPCVHTLLVGFASFFHFFFFHFAIVAGIACALLFFVAGVRFARTAFAAIFDKFYGCSLLAWV